MTAKVDDTSYVEAEEPITLDDIKRRANGVKDLAVSESKRVATEVAQTDVSKAAIVAVGVIVVVASIAYFMGTRAGRRELPTYEI